MKPFLMNVCHSAAVDYSSEDPDEWLISEAHREGLHVMETFLSSLRYFHLV